MKIAQFVQNTFDVLGVEETNTSLVRNANKVSFSFVNESGELEKYVKNETASANVGTFLTTRGKYLMPTGDVINSVGTLLSTFDKSTQTKTVTINGITYTAHLLPVQL